MQHKVFICYASQDKAIAEAVCDALELKNIQCWIAPRDVLPGMEWAETIVDALDESQVIVLVLSSSSNTSPQVIREIGRAAGKGIPIIPFVIEDVSLSKAMDYFISRHQFMDAITPPLEKHLQRLTDTLEKILARRGKPQEVIGVTEAEEAKKAQEAEEKVRKDAEEQAKIEAEEKAKREAEEHAKVEAEEARKGEEAAARVKEEEEAARAKREAEEARKAKKAEEKAKREAEEKDRKETEEKAKREAKEAEERQAEPAKVKAPLLKRWWLWTGAGAVVVAAVLVFLFVFGPGDTAEQHYIAGVALLEEGQYELAVLEFNEAIELDPNYTDAYYSRGEVYLNSEEYDLAIAGFTKAIELNPNHSYAYHDRGLTYYY